MFHKLDNYMNIQVNAVDSLTNQVEVIKQRIMMAKESVGLERFDEVRSIMEIEEGYMLYKYIVL